MSAGNVVAPPGAAFGAMAMLAAKAEARRLIAEQPEIATSILAAAIEEARLVDAGARDLAAMARRGMARAVRETQHWRAE